MSNTIQLKKQVRTTVTEDVNIDVQLPYFAKESKREMPWYYCVTAAESMVVVCSHPDYTYTAIGLRQDVSEAFAKDKAQITREEFEAAFEAALRLTVNSIPKA